MWKKLLQLAIMSRNWLRDNDKPSTRQIIALPSIFDLRKRDGFGINAQFVAGSQCPDLREGLEDGGVGNAATAAAVNLNSRTTQGRGGEGNGWASHVANLNQTESIGLSHHIIAGEGIE